VTTAVATFAVPCRNAGPHLRPLLESLLAQSRQDFELLLVDDASTDGSVGRAQDVAGARLRTVANERPLGLAGNFARCAELVQTPFFCLAHQDDVYERDYLARLLALLDARADAAIAHCAATAIDDAGAPLAAPAERYKRRLAARAAAADRRGLYRRLYAGNFVCCPSVLYRTAAFRAAGGFDGKLSFALDWELWFRMLRGGGTFAWVEEPLVRYRRHAAAASRASTRALSRFVEERAVLAAARREGIAAGLLPPDAGGSPALRNVLLHEAFEDLRAGDRAAVRTKLDFVRTHAPELWDDPWLRAFRGLSQLGAPGRAVLGAGRALAVRLGLGGAHR
jgi:glycosyltransferase involved in cell wall biosynthesis